MSGIFEFLEPEEFVGSRWHRMTRGRSSLPSYPDQACAFERVAGALPVFHHALGGSPSLRFAAAAETTSRHRLSLRLRAMLGEEKIAVARRTDELVLVPARIESFEDAALNRRLYFWLAAFFIEMTPSVLETDDPLLRDLDFLCRARMASEAVLARIPALEPTWRAMARRLRIARPPRPLSAQERMVEAAISKLLGGEGDGGAYWQRVLGCAGVIPRAARGYRTFLPVALWGEVLVSGEARARDGDDASGSSATAQEAGPARRARRNESEQTERKDYLALNRFEKLLTMVESLNINRAVEDDDEEGARRALEDTEELRLSTHSRRAATRLKVELELDARVLPAAGSERADYPEWDYRRRILVPKRVTVRCRQAELSPVSAPEDLAHRAALASVRRTFEAFRPALHVLRGERDGNDLDLEAVVRGQVDLASGGSGRDGIYLQTRRRQRDLSVAILADSSLSTEAAIAERRVLDIEQDALLMLTHALSACGDEHGIFAFSSRRQTDVTIRILKEFTEALGETVEHRIRGLKPTDYTRLGAAIRYGTRRLGERPHGRRLLLVLTDGKPNDIDHYEGRYGIEDTRHAVVEARGRGVTVFGITVDSRAQDYFPAIFGRNAYAIVRDPASLPAACLAIYRTLLMQ